MTAPFLALGVALALGNLRARLPLVATHLHPHDELAQAIYAGLGPSVIWSRELVSALGLNLRPI